MGSAEIYNAVESLPEIRDCLVVGVEQDDGGYWMPLFVALAEDAELDDELRSRITAAIRTGASPRHVPDDIVERARHPAHHDRQAARDPDQANPVGRQARRCRLPERRRSSPTCSTSSRSTPGRERRAGIDAGGFPRIAGCCPPGSAATRRPSRTTENTAAALLLVFTVVGDPVGEFAVGGQLFGRSGTRRSGFSFGDMHTELTVKEIVNDGLMTFFFFIVGLEVTSEFTIGELTDRARAAVPVVAAIAGLIVPALIFLLFNPSGRERAVPGAW